MSNMKRWNLQQLQLKCRYENHDSIQGVVFLHKKTLKTVDLLAPIMDFEVVGYGILKLIDRRITIFIGST